MSPYAFSTRPIARKPLLCRVECTHELRICVHRTCKRQGSEQVLKHANDFGLPGIKATPTGCLGSCGSGPNLFLLPNAQLLHHVATPQDLAQVISTFCGASIDEASLKAMQLRLAGNTHAGRGEFTDAIRCYTSALELQPPVGAHMVYGNRSAAHLQLGDSEAALRDARQAAALAPLDYLTATIRLIDALYAVGQHAEAADVCRRAAAANSSFRFRQEFPVIVKALQAVGQHV